MVGIIFGGGALKCVRLHGGDGLKYRFLPSFGDAIYFLRDAWDATVLRRLTLGSDSVATMLDAFSLCTDSVSDNGRSSDIFRPILQLVRPILRMCGNHVRAHNTANCAHAR